MKRFIIAGLLSIGILFAYNLLEGIKVQNQAALKIVGNHFINI